MKPRRRAVVASLAIVGAAVGVVAWRESGRPSVIALALAAMLAAYVSPVIERWLKDRRLFWPVIIVVSGAIVYALVGATLGAGWSPIDDHEIMKFLGTKKRVGLLEIPVLLMDTEVGQPGGGFARYRPSYYTVRLLETAAWGDSPRAWYAAHLAMFAVSVALGWRFFTRWVGLIPAAVLLLYMLSYEFWADIWSRLGAGEVYCVLGTALWLEAMARLVQLRRPEQARTWSARTAWGMLGLGAWLAMGSKENFVLLVLPVWALAVLAWRRGVLERMGVITLAFLTAYGAMIASAITVSLLRTGADVYRKPVTAAGRLRLFLSGLDRAIEPLEWWQVGVLLIAAIALPALVVRGPSRWRSRPLIRGALLVGGLVALYASQFAFYNGEWPDQGRSMRYNFPGVLSRVLLVVTAGVAGLQLLRRLRIPGGVVRTVGAGLVATLLLFALHSGWAALIQASEAHASATREWTNRLERIAARLRRDPARPVVVVSHEVWDYEPVFAVPRFLNQKGVVNRLYLVTPQFRVDTPLTQVLARTLDGISLFGAAGYAPLDALPPNTVPLAIGLSGPPPPPYENVGTLWPMLASRVSDVTKRDGG